MIEQTELRNAHGAGRFLLVCEHASNAFPEEFGDLGLDAAVREAHVAWDPGALGVARRLSDLLDSPLVAATVSRLVYDCNRPPDATGAMPPKSEVYDIFGNRDIRPEERLARTESVYLPFHTAVSQQLARMLALGQRPVFVTVHSFTPVWFGQKRDVQFGIIHDTDPHYAEAVVAAARDLPLNVALNEPYSAADGVVHTLRLHATPHDLAHAMLEIRNDLLGDTAAQEAMAGDIAVVLERALAAHDEDGRAA
ncbi:MAG: N-formylglutamate amidohydrolase [Rubellimicrobium sp.]|nr:N-formylglutamate amidohydrolase [Rubellimicrobium sp.]